MTSAQIARRRPRTPAGETEFPAKSIGSASRNAAGFLVCDPWSTTMDSNRVSADDLTHEPPVVDRRLLTVLKPSIRMALRGRLRVQPATVGLLHSECSPLVGAHPGTGGPPRRRRPAVRITPSTSGACSSRTSSTAACPSGALSNCDRPYGTPVHPRAGVRPLSHASARAGCRSSSSSRRTSSTRLPEAATAYGWARSRRWSRLLPLPKKQHAQRLAGQGISDTRASLP